MISPARRLQQHKLAAQAAAPAKRATALIPMPSTGPIATEHAQLLIQLGEHLRELSNTQSVERKIEAKRTMIDVYRPWVNGAIASATPRADDIVTTMMVWAVDVGDFDWALQIGAFVLAHDLPLPERYSRTAATVLAEEIADAALADPAAVPMTTLIAADELTAARDMHDQVRAKLMKAIGRNLMAQLDAFEADAEDAVAGGRAALNAAALKSMRRALALNGSVGVKKDIELLQREERKLAEEHAGNSGQGGTAG